MTIATGGIVTTDGDYKIHTFLVSSECGTDVCNDGTATASEEWSSYVAANAFDGNQDSLWIPNLIGTYPVWIQYDFGIGVTKVAARYVMKASGGANRMATDWLFQGSNVVDPGSGDWTTLDTRVAQASYGGYEIRSYFLGNSTPYRYYRWYMTAGVGGQYLVLGDLEILEVIGGTDCFIVTSAGDVEALVVGGGGSGGTRYGGGGGGGEVLYEAVHAVTVQTHPITVGDGGAAQTVNAQNGYDGEDSIFDDMVANKGLAGEGGRTGLSCDGGDSGSGTTGGSGTGQVEPYLGGGGAGDSSNGEDYNGNVAGDGGTGTESSISGSPVKYGGGGGGGAYVGYGATGAGTGTDGGGDGNLGGTADAGAENRGCGGGGAGGDTGISGAGGKGIVIIRYPLTQSPLCYLHARRDRMNMRGVSTQNQLA
jgi:hypothetical protein